MSKEYYQKNRERILSNQKKARARKKFSQLPLWKRILYYIFKKV